jgi:hypothetical protein
MPTLTPVFHQESEKVHHEHGVLIQELAALDLLLDKLDSSDVQANLATAKQVEISAKHFAQELPDHFRREEEKILSVVSGVSIELETLTNELKRQHAELRQELDQFCRDLAQLAGTAGLDQTMARVKEDGKRLTRELGRHIALEEHELSGFL